MRLALCVLLTGGPAAWAQEPADPWGPPLLAEPEPAIPTWEIALAGLAIGAGNLADLHSTRELVAAGGHEALNPGVFGRDAERVIPVKLGVIAIETGIFYAFRRWRKEAAWVFVAGVLALTVGATIHNRRLTARLRADRLGTQTGRVPVAGFQVSFSW